MSIETKLAATVRQAALKSAAKPAARAVATPVAAAVDANLTAKISDAVVKREFSGTMKGAVGSLTVLPHAPNANYVVFRGLGTGTDGKTYSALIDFKGGYNIAKGVITWFTDAVKHMSGV